MSDVGKRIHDRRVQMGLSADDLAERLGKHRATIYRYESDDIENMPIDIIKPLAEILQVSPSYLMGWTESSDVYSARFLERLDQELSCIGKQGDPAVDAEYDRLHAMVREGGTLSLASACEAADTLGCSMSYMLQEIDEDIDLSETAARKASEPAKTESEAKVEQEIIGRVRRMGFAQQSLLLAILKTSVELSQQMPPVSQETVGDKAKVSDR